MSHHTFFAQFLDHVQVLTTNQCVEMLLRYSETLDWKSAVHSIFPKRKLAPTATPAADKNAQDDEKSASVDQTAEQAATT